MNKGLMFISALVLGVAANTVAMSNLQRNVLATIDRATPSADTDLARAALLGDVAAARQAINNGANVNSGAWYPLQKAVLSNNKQMVELLLKNGANPNMIDAKGRNILGFAAENNKGMIPLLLQYGANPDQVDKEGRTYNDILKGQKRQRVQRRTRR